MGTGEYCQKAKHIKSNLNYAKLNLKNIVLQQRLLFITTQLESDAQFYFSS